MRHPIAFLHTPRWHRCIKARVALLVVRLSALCNSAPPLQSRRRSKKSARHIFSNMPPLTQQPCKWKFWMIISMIEDKKAWRFQRSCQVMNCVELWFSQIRPRRCLSKSYSTSADFEWELIPFVVGQACKFSNWDQWNDMIIHRAGLGGEPKDS